MGLWLVLGCSDDGVGSSDNEGSTAFTSASTGNPPTTQTQTTLPSGTTELDSSGSPPTTTLGSSGETTSSSSSGEATSSSSSGEATSSSSSGDMSSSSGETTTGSSSSGGTGGSTGFCGLECMVPAECGDPADWACTGGFCEFLGPIPVCDPIMCDDLLPGFFCSEVDGNSACLIGCMNDVDCTPFDFVCTGVDDFGDSFCEGPPCGGVAIGDPCDFGTGDQYGVCDGDMCICNNDAECTAPGFGCQL